MKSHSLLADLRTLELGREHAPRFSKDTTDREMRDALDDLKRKVREQRDSLIKKHEGATGAEERIGEIHAAADRILSL